MNSAPSWNGLQTAWQRLWCAVLGVTQPGEHIADPTVQRLRALGLSDQEIREHLALATSFAAVNANPELAVTFVKIAASAEITTEDLHRMRQHGIKINITTTTTPAALAAGTGIDTDTHWANGERRLLTPEAFERMSTRRGESK